MFSDKLYDEVSTKYADMMVDMFPDYKDDYKTFKARAKNVLMFIFNNYCLIPNEVVQDAINIDIHEPPYKVLEKLFGEDVIDSLIYDMYNKK